MLLIYGWYWDIFASNSAQKIPHGTDSIWQRRRCSKAACNIFPSAAFYPSNGADLSIAKDEEDTSKREVWGNMFVNHLKLEMERGKEDIIQAQHALEPHVDLGQVAWSAGKSQVNDKT